MKKKSATKSMSDLLSKRNTLRSRIAACADGGYLSFAIKLADAIHAGGGWVYGAKFAAVCKTDMSISFYRDKPEIEGDYWDGSYINSHYEISELPYGWNEFTLDVEDFFIFYPDGNVLGAGDGLIHKNGCIRFSSEFKPHIGFNGNIAIDGVLVNAMVVDFSDDEIVVWVSELGRAAQVKPDEFCSFASQNSPDVFSIKHVISSNKDLDELSLAALLVAEGFRRGGNK